MGHVEPPPPPPPPPPKRHHQAHHPAPHLLVSTVQSMTGHPLDASTGTQTLNQATMTGACDRVPG